MNILIKLAMLVAFNDCLITKVTCIFYGSILNCDTLYYGQDYEKIIDIVSTSRFAYVTSLLLLTACAPLWASGRRSRTVLDFTKPTDEEAFITKDATSAVISTEGRIGTSESYAVYAIVKPPFLKLTATEDTSKKQLKTDIKKYVLDGDDIQGQRLFVFLVSTETSNKVPTLLEIRRAKKKGNNKNSPKNISVSIDSDSKNIDHYIWKIKGNTNVDDIYDDINTELLGDKNLRLLTTTDITTDDEYKKITEDDNSVVDKQIIQHIYDKDLTSLVKGKFPEGKEPILLIPVKNSNNSNKHELIALNLLNGKETEDEKNKLDNTVIHKLVPKKGSKADDVLNLVKSYNNNLVPTPCDTYEAMGVISEYFRNQGEIADENPLKKLFEENTWGSTDSGYLWRKIKDVQVGTADPKGYCYWLFAPKRILSLVSPSHDGQLFDEGVEEESVVIEAINTTLTREVNRGNLENIVIPFCIGTQDLHLIQFNYDTQEKLEIKALGGNGKYTFVYSLKQDDEINVEKIAKKLKKTIKSEMPIAFFIPENKREEVKEKAEDIFLQRCKSDFEAFRDDVISKYRTGGIFANCEHRILIPRVSSTAYNQEDNTVDVGVIKLTDGDDDIKEENDKITISKNKFSDLTLKKLGETVDNTNFVNLNKSQQMTLLHSIEVHQKDDNKEPHMRKDTVVLPTMESKVPTLEADNKKKIKVKAKKKTITKRKKIEKRQKNIGDVGGGKLNIQEKMLDILEGSTNKHFWYQGLSKKGRTVLTKQVREKTVSEVYESLEGDILKITELRGGTYLATEIRLLKNAYANVCRLLDGASVIDVFYRNKLKKLKEKLERDIREKELKEATHKFYASTQGDIYSIKKAENQIPNVVKLLSKWNKTMEAKEKSMEKFPIIRISVMFSLFGASIFYVVKKVSARKNKQVEEEDDDEEIEEDEKASADTA